MRTAIGAAASGAAWRFTAPASAASAFDGVTLRVAVYRGQDKPLLQAAGLIDTPYKVEYSEFSAGNLIIEALNAGALDMGSWSEIPLVFAAESSAAVRTVAILRGDTNLQVVLVPKDSPIKTISDLKGKRVGYVRATTCHYFLLKMLWQAGLDFSDITPVNLSPSDGQAAFQSGALDAWAIYGYYIEFARANGAQILKSANGILSGNYHIGIRPDIVRDAKLRPAVADYLVRMRKAYAWREANKESWSKIVSPIIGVPLPMVLDSNVNESQPDVLCAIDAGAIASAQDVERTFRKAGVFRQEVDVTGYFDTSFSAELTAA